MKRKVDSSLGVNDINNGYRNSITCEIAPGFTYCSKRCRFSLEKLHFSGKEGMRSFSEFLGEGSLFGLRLPRPKIDSGNHEVSMNDYINCVTEATLTFFNESISVKVLYQAYHLIVDEAGAPVGCIIRELQNYICCNNMNDSSNLASRSHVDDALLKVGTEFEHNGDLFVIQSFDGELCIISNSKGRVEKIENSISIQQIIEYLS